MTDASHEGHCLCGNIRYQVAGDPLWSGHCHCGTCRRNTGSAIASFVGFKRDQFALTSGELKAYASSPGASRLFCADCGTPVAFESTRYPGEIHLFLGTLAAPENYPPQFHVHCRERLSWLDVQDGAKRFDTAP